MIAGAIVIGYMVAMVIIGVITSKYVKTLEDFILAGRRLGPWLVALAFNTTALSGWLILGVSGWVYREGFTAVWTLWGSGCFAVLASYIVLGEYVRRFSKATGALTIPDILEVRYYDREKHILRWISAIIIFISTIIYIGGMQAAVAKGFAYVFGLGRVESILISMAVVTFYTLMGGLPAAVWSDVIQGVIMVLVSIFFIVAAIAGVGGELFSKVDAIAVADPGFVLSPWASPSVVLYGISLILFASILSYMGQPQLLNKFMAARDHPAIRKASFISLVTQIILFIGAFMCGLAARVLWPSAAQLPNRDTELVAPFLLENILGPVALGILWAGVLAATMSTADSLMVMASASIVNDLYYKVFNPGASQELLKKLSMVVTGIVGVLGVIIAFQPLLVLWSIWLGWSGLAVFVTLLLPGLFNHRVTREAAIAALITSFITGMLWFYFGLHRVVHIAMPSQLVGFATIFLVSYLTKPPPKEVIELIKSVRRSS